MAQYKVETGSYDSKISKHFEVMMLANNANGDIVTTTNPLQFHYSPQMVKKIQ